MAAGRFVVVGGGIAGGFAAFHLARAGAEVTIVERDEIGAQASGNNPGGLNPLYGAGIPGPLQDLALASFRLHLEHADEIMRRAGGVAPPRRKVRVNLVLEDADVDDLERMHAAYTAADGFGARWVERAELLDLEPRLGPEVRRGLWAEGDARVDARAYTRAVVRAAEDLGATVLEAEVIGVEVAGDRVTAVRTTAGPIPCAGIVVATGAWCEGPAEWLEVAIPMEPVKGDLVVVDLEGGVPADLAGRDSAIYRLDAGTALLGGTEERAGFDRTVSGSARDSIVRRCARLVPVLADAPVRRQSTGLRPVTPDGMPIVGTVPSFLNAWLAVGGGRKGMLLGAGMGKAVAELALAGETALPVLPCAVGRFAVSPASAKAKA